jgi:hypothetical protein
VYYPLMFFPRLLGILVVAIGSTTQSTLKFEDVVASLLLEEMRRKSMKGVANDVLFVRDFPIDRNENKTLQR